MELSVSLSKKKDITNSVILGTKKLHIIQIMSHVLLWGSLIVGILYGLISFVAQKNIPQIVVASSFIIIIGLFIAIALHYLLKNLAGKEIGERIDEACVISDDCFIYSFRMKHFSTPTSKTIVTIPINHIQAIDYDEKLKRLTIKGDITYSFYYDFKKNIKSDDGDSKLNNWVLYDYFTPSLYEALKN